MTAVSGTVLILGASSDIGMALARAYAQAGCSLILAARHHARLETDVEDLRLRYQAPPSLATVRAVEFDALDTANHGRFLDDLGPLPDVVVCVVGLLGDQAVAETDAQAADLIMRSNYNGPALALNEAASRMQRRGSGQIIGISSVGGERGRASNYVYGSAKAGFTAFLSGMRNRLASTGVRVMTVKPGFVNTRMTAGMKLSKRLTAEAAEVANAVLRAQRAGRDVIYVRPIWRPIMLVIRCLPEPIFKRTKL
jgi:NAD(P)-dependent dehydrogenase (short-subunit alcohol dehydrogenase family)